MMYATRARRARPEPFAVRPGIAERLGLPYMDGTLAFSAAALVAFSVFTLGQATKHDVPGNPVLLRRPPGDLRRARDRRHVPPDPHRLLALPRAAGRHLHLPLRQHLAGLRLRLRRARLAALLRTSLLQFPAIGARQGPARSWPLPGLSSMAPGRGSDGSARCATSASAWHRLRSSSCSRTSAPRWCSGQSPSP